MQTFELVRIFGAVAARCRIVDRYWSQMLGTVVLTVVRCSIEPKRRCRTAQVGPDARVVWGAVLGVTSEAAAALSDPSQPRSLQRHRMAFASDNGREMRVSVDREEFLFLVLTVRSVKAVTGRWCPTRVRRWGNPAPGAHCAHGDLDDVDESLFS